MIEGIEFKKLIQSVTYYLSYQDKIGKSFMIDESSLKYPVAEYLSSLKISLSSIRLEYPHPKLRRRQIDLVKLDDRKNGAIDVAFEFKMARTSTRYESEQRRVFNDLMRLHLLKVDGSEHCYFMMAGKQDDFIQHFRSIVTKRPSSMGAGEKRLPNPKGFYTEWFGFKLGAVTEITVDSKMEEPYKSIYDNFLAEYKSKEEQSRLVLPRQIKIKCIAISALSVDYPTPYVGGMWEVW
jgi:hypothetical protein